MILLKIIKLIEDYKNAKTAISKLYDKSPSIPSFYHSLLDNYVKYLERVVLYRSLNEFGFEIQFILSDARKISYGDCTIIAEDRFGNIIEIDTEAFEMSFFTKNKNIGMRTRAKYYSEQSGICTYEEFYKYDSFYSEHQLEVKKIYNNDNYDCISIYYIDGKESSWKYFELIISREPSYNESYRSIKEVELKDNDFIINEYYPHENNNLGVAF